MSPYVFDENPVCNYPETVTFTDLPTFVTHNAPTSDDFTVPVNNDLSLLGSYTVTIRSEIEVPDDYTKTTFTKWFEEYDFIVYMQPCVVGKYEATQMITKIVYNVNALDVTSNKY